MLPARLGSQTAEGKAREGLVQVEYPTRSGPEGKGARESECVRAPHENLFDSCRNLHYEFELMLCAHANPGANTTLRANIFT